MSNTRLQNSTLRKSLIYDKQQLETMELRLRKTRVHFYRILVSYTVHALLAKPSASN